MREAITIGILLIISISCYAQESQESYTLLMLEFENRSSIENPLLEAFNETIAFLLSRQTGPAQVRLIPNADRDALLARAAAEQPDATLSEQGLLAAEWIDADALVAGSYTKQERWSLKAQVYHRREDRKTLQEIQIQGDGLYQLMDEFPVQLLQQFTTNASHIALTTDSWKAYEEFRKGHQAFERYDFFGSQQYYEKALALDPTLALAYAEQNHIYAMTGQKAQAAAAIESAKKYMMKASPMEQLAIRALAYSWDSEKSVYRDWLHMWGLYGVEHLTPESIASVVGRSLAPGGIWDEPMIYQLVAGASILEGNQAEADKYYQRWFRAIQTKIRAYPEDAGFLHQAAEYCFAIRKHLDEAIDMELKALELEPEGKWRENGYVLIKLYELEGDMEQSAQWAEQIAECLPDPRFMQGMNITWPTFAPGGFFFAWNHLAKLLHEGKIPSERLLKWCEGMLNSPELHLPARIRTQHLLADVYNAMNDTANTEATLASIGAPYEKDWMVLGPLDRSEAGNLFPEPPPFTELFADLEKVHVGIMDREMRWESWEDEQPMDGAVDIWWTFNTKYYDTPPFAHNQPPAIVYNCIYAKLPAATEVQVRTGFGPMKVWLNENPSPVIQVNGILAPAPDKVVTNISLNAGLNRFLVGTVSGNSFGFYFRITDDDGNTVPGLEYISAKEVLASD